MYPNLFTHSQKYRITAENVNITPEFIVSVKKFTIFQKIIAELQK